MAEFTLLDPELPELSPLNRALAEKYGVIFNQELATCQLPDKRLAVLMDGIHSPDEIASKCGMSSSEVRALISMMRKDQVLQWTH